MRQKKVVFGAAARLAPPLEKGGSPIEATPGSQDSVRVEMFYEISERSADFCEFLASGTEFPLVGESAREENKGGACSWGQVDIGFVDSDSVRLKVKGRSLGRKTFTEMGFADGRSGRTDKTKVSPQKAWLLLELIARKGELRAPPRSSSRRKRDDAAEQFHAAQRGSEEWVPASRATAGAHKVPQDDPSTARKLIQKMRRLLRKKLKSLGYAIPSNSDPLPCRDGKWRAAFTLTHDETDRP